MSDKEKIEALQQQGQNLLSQGAAQQQELEATKDKLIEAQEKAIQYREAVDRLAQMNSYLQSQVAQVSMLQSEVERLTAALETHTTAAKSRGARRRPKKVQ